MPQRPEAMRDRIGSLPTDHRGFPVPWFVAWQAGQPDFRCVAAGKLDEAVRRSLCWVCGQPLGRFKTFVTGPLCAITGTSAEPPSHRECAEQSARLCPFLSKPRMRRNERDLLIDAPHPVGDMIDRNPGVTLLWTTTTFRTVHLNGGVMFRVGAPESVQWFARGRAATRTEVLASIDTGVPLLRAQAEREGAAAVQVLERLVQTAMRIVPR